MKKIDLEKAKAGSPIVTRDGRPARLLGERKHPDYPIIAVVKKSYDLEEVYSYTNDGHNISTDETENDLFMAPTKRVKYANLYFDKERKEYKMGDIYDTEAESLFLRMRDCKYIKTIKIEWEE